MATQSPHIYVPPCRQAGSVRTALADTGVPPEYTGNGLNRYLLLFRPQPSPRQEFVTNVFSRSLVILPDVLAMGLLSACEETQVSAVQALFGTTSKVCLDNFRFLFMHIVCVNV